MKTKYILIIPAIVVAGLLSAAALAQRGTVSPVENTLQIAPGQEFLLHASQDTVIEIYIDLPLTSPEKIKIADAETGKKLALPSGAWVRAQGHVVVSRDAEPGIASPQIRWRYVDSIFASYSR